jgi:hypothetical protein
MLENSLAANSRVLVDVIDEREFRFIDHKTQQLRSVERVSNTPPQYLANGFINPNWLRAAETRRTESWTQWAERHWSRSSKSDS